MHNNPYLSSSGWPRRYFVTARHDETLYFTSTKRKVFQIYRRYKQILGSNPLHRLCEQPMRNNLPHRLCERAARSNPVPIFIFSWMATPLLCNGSP